MHVPTSPPPHTAAEDAVPGSATPGPANDPPPAAHSSRRVIIGTSSEAAPARSDAPPPPADQLITPETNSAAAPQERRRVIGGDASAARPTREASWDAPAARATPMPPAALRTSWAYRGITGGLLA